MVARDFEDYPEEDDCCLECGEIAYTPSKTSGICRECWDELTLQNESRPLAPF